jgi:pimeloyl-ACP methyl ester carboxylesterase
MLRTLAAVLLLLSLTGTWASPDDRSRIPDGGEAVTRHYATVDSLQIHYRQAGAGRQTVKRPVIALHQSPNSSQVFVEFLSVFASDRRVIAPDTPGFGSSDRPPAQPTIADDAALDADLLSREWQGSKSWQGPGQSDRSIERTFLAKITAGQTAWWGPDAVFRYPLLERLAEIPHPLTVIRAGDDLWEATERVRTVRPDARFIDLPEYKFALFEIAPERLADLAREAFGADGEPPGDPP